MKSTAHHCRSIRFLLPRLLGVWFLGALIAACGGAQPGTEEAKEERGAAAGPPAETSKAGMAIISTDGDSLMSAEKVSRYDHSDLSVVKIHMPSAFSSDPKTVQQLIDRGVTTVILRTWDSRISATDVKNEIERTQGSGKTYDALIRGNPGVRFWLEVGNEPDMAKYVGVGTAAGYRQAALNTYKTLAVTQNWRGKYPNLKWALSLPTKKADVDVVLQWLPADGGVRDYYDAMATHLYGAKELLKDPHNEWTTIFDFLNGDPYTKAILITEAGINDPLMSDTDKAKKYFAFTRDKVHTNSKIKAITYWHFDTNPDNTAGFAYSMDSKADLHINRYGY